MKQWRYVKYEKNGHIVIITMNRPERFNSTSIDMMHDLFEVWDEFNGDNNARVAVVTGTGNSFCAGMDTVEAIEAVKKGERINSPHIYFDTKTKPVIGAINGYSIGSGLFMALQTDLRIAAKSAIFWAPEIFYNMSYVLGPVFRGDFADIPDCLMTEIILMGRKITAKRIYEMGLINAVVPDVELMPTAMKWAEEIVALPPMAVRTIVEGMRKRKNLRKLDGELTKWVDALYDEALQSEDFAEGIKAYAEKRKAVFKGR